jgi:glucan phosphoethanolaminetransferase (alkaline phosphatase superfamily)
MRQDLSPRAGKTKLRYRIACLASGIVRVKVARYTVGLALLAWICGLFLPNLSLAGYLHSAASDRLGLVASGAWTVIALAGLLPRGAFLILSFPLLMIGSGIVFADLYRGVNLMMLLGVLDTFSAAEIRNTLEPLRIPALLLCAALALLGGFLWRHRFEMRWSRAVKLAVATTGLVGVVFVPAQTWQESWPIAVFSVAASSTERGVRDLLPSVQQAAYDPRNHRRSWHATRSVTPERDEIYVFVIGESIRSDRLRECGGRKEVSPVPAHALVFCDMIAGSSGTHTSVPLLVSRDLPGLARRIPDDRTFLAAFEEVGFASYWFSLHEQRVAWADAQTQLYFPSVGLDRKLLPHLDEALANRQAARKVIVLHLYNAHFPYFDRFRPEVAPFQVETGLLQGTTPTRETLSLWWNAYDDAVDESLRFLGDLVDRLRGQSGDVFVVYLPDHGENMLDDERQLIQHALAFPTRFDVAVPMVVWANESWREHNPSEWAMLERNKGGSLIHADAVPTILGAAGIRYEEPRQGVVDLSHALAGRRERMVEVREGYAVSYASLIAGPQADYPVGQGVGAPFAR